MDRVEDFLIPRGWTAFSHGLEFKGDGIYSRFWRAMGPTCELLNFAKFREVRNAGGVVMEVIHSVEMNLIPDAAVKFEHVVRFFEASEDGPERPLFEDIFFAKLAWSLGVFGPESGPRRIEAICRHIERELTEVRKAPTDPKEWVDIMFLAMDALGRLGHTGEDVLRLMQEKHEANRLRPWPPLIDQKPGEPVEALD